MTLLELRDLSAGYGEARIVHGVSLLIDAGETVALLGRNGMGKTTLLRAIFGLAERQGGDVLIDGLSSSTRPELVARRGLALVPDDRGVLPSLTVGENLQLARGISGADPEVEPLEVLPDLRTRTNQPAGELSGGLQQQLALARALSTGARLVAIDELSQGLQPSIVEALAGTLERVARETQIALLIVEQNPQLALRLCERTVVLEKGRVVADEPSATIAAKDRLSDLLVVSTGRRSA